MSRFAGRRTEQIWFLFCLMHIPTSLLIDLQGLYPIHWLANTPLPGFLEWYLSMSKDPVLKGARGNDPAWSWIRCFILLEGMFQVPCFVIGAIGLWINDKRVYPLLLAYGASTATTLIPVLDAILFIPHKPALSTPVIANLMGTYLPFLFIPLIMAVDMSVKIVKLINVAQTRKAI